MKWLPHAALILCSVFAADSARAATICANTIPASRRPTEAQTIDAVPSLTLSAPCAEALKDRQVYIAFRVENMTILPLYTEVNGEAATELAPKVGHLHVTVDDAGYSWIHASLDPIYFGAIAPGPHSVRVELVNAAHKTIRAETLRFVAG